MSSQILKYYPLLKKIVRMGNAARARIIKQCNREVMYCISECARNVLKGIVPLKRRQFTKLRRRKKDVSALASRRTSLKKRAIVQKGGFLASLLVPVIAALSSCHGRVQTCRPMGACIACLVISVGGVCGRCWS